MGGIIPEEDRATLLASGVTAVYTPKDFDLTRIMTVSATSLTPSWCASRRCVA